MKSLGDSLRMLREASGITQAKAAEFLTEQIKPVDARSISKWENNVAEPSVECFLHLSQKYGVNNFYATYFDNSDELCLNAEGIKKANDYITLLLQSEQFVEQAACQAKRKLRFFDIPVSAGFGQFLDSDHFEWQEVDASVPAAASFAVRISGDSMEPYFTNKQWVYVQEQPALEHGEIGVFLYDGESYCKRLEKTPKGLKLLSANKQYKAINVVMLEEFKVLGKVLC